MNKQSSFHGFEQAGYHIHGSGYAADPRDTKQTEPDAPRKQSNANLFTPVRARRVKKKFEFLVGRRHKRAFAKVVAPMRARRGVEQWKQVRQNRQQHREHLREKAREEGSNKIT